MKKNIATYLAVLSLLFVGASCSDDDDETVVAPSPYAYVYSFGIGNIMSPFHDFTVEGKDTVIEKLVSGEDFLFVVDQKKKEIYNPDSLTYGTDVSKVVTSVSCTGTPYRFDEYSNSYLYYSSTDSINFVNPVNLRVVSTDGAYFTDYLIKINVHKVDPELLVWKEYNDDALSEITPVSLVEKDAVIYLFGKKADKVAVATTSSTGTPSWSVTDLDIPLDSDIASVKLFGGKFYLLSGSDLLVSDDAVNWSVALADCGFTALLGAVDGGDKLMVANDSEILYSTDGVDFSVTESLPAGFPVYGCSFVASSLKTNSNIHRNLLVGYADAACEGDVKVWSKLSTEQEWSAYDFFGSGYKCPAFEKLAVLGYDGALYAFGGTAIVNDTEIPSFAGFYVSNDNGIVWKACSDYNVALPAGLKGAEPVFATTVASDNYIWIVTPTAVWKGRINRLGF